MKRILILNLFVLFNVSLTFSQKIEQDTIDGTIYYVYPFDNALTVHTNYYIAVKRPKGQRYSYKQYYLEMFGDNYNKRDFRKSRRKAFARALKNRKYNKGQRYFNRKFKKAVKKNPFPLLEQRYTLESDIIPCLDNIPDGKYVQYFSGYFPIGKNGRMTFEEKRVSGYFTIKNNMLEGEAIWFNAKGDTLKKGNFEKGLKVGTWFVENRRASYSLSKMDVKAYIERGYPDMDTLTEYVDYAGGFKNGHYEMFQNSELPVMEGEYTDNEISGQWTEREIGYTGKGKNRKRNRNNTIITWTYSPSLKDTAVHQPIIRKTLIKDISFNSKFDFDPKFEPKINFNKLYTINYPKELDIELEEETITSYEGAEYENEYYDEEYGYEDEYGYGEEYYGDEYYGDDNGSFMNFVYDRNSGEYVELATLIDSLGVIFNYQGIYEKRYPNGQLMVRYEFENGKLLQEDTIFWDNGKPYDVITFEADSNQYLHTIYDYNGLLYNQIVHDSIGAFVRVNFQPEKIKYVYIDGFKAEDRGYGKYYFYDKLDTLDFEIKDSLVLFRSWFKQDSSLMYSRTFDPHEQLLKFQMYSVTGKPSLEAELKFSENYESWTGYKSYRLGDIEMKTTTSASYSEYIDKDTIPQRHINDYDGSFMTTEDYTLSLDEKPFTGNINITLNEKTFSYKTGSEIKLSLPKSYAMSKKLNKDFEKYKKTGKTKNEILFNTIDASEFDEDFGSSMFSYLFDGFIGEYLTYSYSDYEGYEMEGSVREKKENPFSKKIVGYLKDGKPQGIWKIYDQFGKIQYEIPFEKGLMHGTVKEYDVKYPVQSYDYYRPELEYLKDSVPKKKTHYLYSTAEYKNGMLHGDFKQYNWLGTVNKKESYKDNMRDGSAFERNNLAYTVLNYKEGGLDGYVQTYLTLKGQDSMLLFDLNFQNGLLQGESRSYHTNGELAKRGFFLNGDAIDDYEAYDTLGFKYHYVKFLYSYPVEEKIWEENELSVRYQFDWRDSIYFQPSDITTSQSLDRILAQLGIGGDYYNRPYYGRPSLVNKEGIDYHITKYYPNDTIARDGVVSAGKKVGCWKYYSYEGQFLYEADYFDTIISINDSIQFKAKGILTDYNDNGDKISDSWIIEKFEKYDCSHTDHYEIRQLMTIWQGVDSMNRMNGYVKNHYDNGVLQNEGWMKDGLPTGVWKFYDPYGKLNQVGTYVLGKRDGRWLGGDLSKTKYLGDICLNPNLPNLEEEIKYRENLLDIVITNYKMGKALNKEFYDVNMNNYEEEAEEGELDEIEEE